MISFLDLFTVRKETMLNTIKTMYECKINEYDITVPINFLGNGTFGNVYRYNNMACKMFKNRECGKREALIMQELNKKSHRNVIRCYGGISFENSFCLFYELLSHKTLRIAIQQDRQKSNVGCRIRTIIYITKSLLLAMQHLRENHQLIHADIKPDNIGFLKVDTKQKTVVKLFDFGCALKLPCTLKDMIQTNFYRAPEVFGEKGKPRDIDFNVDMFSLGCTVAEMYTGRPLFCYQEQTIPHFMRKWKTCVQKERFRRRRDIKDEGIIAEEANEFVLLNEILKNSLIEKNKRWDAQTMLTFVCNFQNEI